MEAKKKDGKDCGCGCVPPGKSVKARKEKEPGTKGKTEKRDD